MQGTDSSWSLLQSGPGGGLQRRSLLHSQIAGKPRGNPLKPFDTAASRKRVVQQAA